MQKLNVMRADVQCSSLVTVVAKTVHAALVEERELVRFGALGAKKGKEEHTFPSRSHQTPERAVSKSR